MCPNYFLCTDILSRTQTKSGDVSDTPLDQIV